MNDEMDHLMTDADFERALDALHEDGDTEVGDLLRAMNENRIISWEEAERILCDASNEPIKSSLPQQTRPTEPDNDTDVDQSIQRLLQNDPKLVEINLNNMKRTPIPQIKRILEAIRENTSLEKISLANMGLYDTDVAPLIEVLEDNETLRAVNVETNYLSGDFFARLLRAALKNQTLEEIKGVNQGVAFSTAAEREIIDAIVQNRGLTKVSINFRLPEGRHKVEQATIRNLEIRRILRRQAAAEARAAEEAAAAKAARMGDISPARTSTVGKPPTKKQLAMENGASTSELKPTRPVINPKQVNNNLEPPRSSAIAKRANALIANVNPDFAANIEAPDSPKSFAPMILASPPEKRLSDSDGSTQSPTSKSRPRRSITASTTSTSVDQYDDEPSANSSSSMSAKSKPPVRKLSTDIETMYTKSSNNEVKVAFIPEAPVGRASLIAKKFEKKEASARKEIERNTRRLSATKKPSDFMFNVAAVLPNVSADMNEIKEVENKKVGSLKPVNEQKKVVEDSGVDEKVDLNHLNAQKGKEHKEPSKWRQRMDEEARKKLENNSVNANDEATNIANVSKTDKEIGKDDVAKEPRQKRLDKSSKIDFMKSKLEDRAIKSEKGRSGEKFTPKELPLRRKLLKSETVDEARDVKSFSALKMSRTASKDEREIPESTSERLRKKFGKLDEINERSISKSAANSKSAVTNEKSNTTEENDSKFNMKTKNNEVKRPPGKLDISTDKHKVPIENISIIPEATTATKSLAVKSKTLNDVLNENVEIASSSRHLEKHVDGQQSKNLTNNTSVRDGTKLDEIPNDSNIAVTPKLRRKKLNSEKLTDVDGDNKHKDILSAEIRTPKSSRRNLKSHDVDHGNTKSEDKKSAEARNDVINSTSHDEISRSKISRQKTAATELTEHSSIAEILESKKSTRDTKYANDNLPSQKSNIPAQNSTVPSSNTTLSKEEEVEKEDSYVYIPLTTRPKRLPPKPHKPKITAEGGD